MSKRTVALFVCMVILITMVYTGCGTSNTVESKSTTVQAAGTDNPVTSASDAVSTGYSLPLSTSGETISIMTADNMTNVSVATGLPVFNEIEKRTGVKIKWELLAPCSDLNGYATKMQTRVASGTDMPDLILINSLDDPSKYVTSGLLAQVDDLIMKDAPNLSKMLTDDKALKALLTSPDGKMYLLPYSYTEDNGGANDKYNGFVINIREDWLTKLNLKEPATIDEFHNVLKAFKENDPNGNQKKDEIPLSSWGGNAAEPFAWMFGIHVMNDSFYPDNSGKVVYDCVTPKFKDMLTVMNQWYKEGLIDPGIAKYPNIDWDKLSANMLNGLIGCVFGNALTPESAWNATIRTNTNNPKARFIAMHTPTGPDGTNITEMMSLPNDMGWFGLTKYCKNPDLAMKWLDYASFSDDAVKFSEYGIEGLTYNLKDGKVVYTDKVLKSSQGFDTEMFNIGAEHYSIPQRMTVESRSTMFHALPNLSDADFKIFDDIFQQAKKTPRFPKMLASEDETSQLNSILTDFNTYRDEMIMKFITGTEPISNFDKFVSTLKGMGLDTILKIKQAQYDRYLKAIK